MAPTIVMYRISHDGMRRPRLIFRTRRTHILLKKLFSSFVRLLFIRVWVSSDALRQRRPDVWCYSSRCERTVTTTAWHPFNANATCSFFIARKLIDLRQRNTNEAFSPKWEAEQENRLRRAEWKGMLHEARCLHTAIW